MWRLCPFTQCQYHSISDGFCVLADFSFKNRTSSDCQLKRMADENRVQQVIKEFNDLISVDKITFPTPEVRCFVHGQWDMAAPVEKKLYKHIFFVQFYREWITISGRKEDEIVIESPKKHSFIPDRFNRKITTCVIHPVDTAKFYSGIAVLHPGEDDHPLTGAKQAFTKAVQEMAEAENFQYKAFAELFITPLLKKEFSEDSKSDNYIFNNHGFVLHVKLPWEAKHGHR